MAILIALNAPVILPGVVLTSSVALRLVFLVTPPGEKRAFWRAGAGILITFLPVLLMPVLGDWVCQYYLQ